MKLNPAMKRCLAQAKAKHLELLPKLAYLERIARDAPDYAERVAEVRDLVDHVGVLCSACLTAAEESAEAG